MKFSFKHEVYSYAEVGRGGLGNLLFPWARCLLWSHIHGVTALPPHWFRIRLGPWLRRERDKRQYHILFRAPKLSDRLLRSAALLRLPHRPEPSLRAAPSGAGVYMFQGLRDYFAPLRGHHEAIGSALRAILKPAHVPPRKVTAFIAIHIRRGDFTMPTSDQQLREGGINYRVPVEWYREVLRAIRAGVGAAVPAVVFSDGDPRDLLEILKEPLTSLHSSRSAVSDLLTMSQAGVLIASGSTFSMWASFLGQVPSVWYPGQRREALLDGDRALRLEPEWDGGRFSAEFAAAMSRRLSQRAESRRV